MSGATGPPLSFGGAPYVSKIRRQMIVFGDYASIAHVKLAGHHRYTAFPNIDVGFATVCRQNDNGFRLFIGCRGAVINHRRALEKDGAPLVSIQPIFTDVEGFKRIFVLTRLSVFGPIASECRRKNFLAADLGHQLAFGHVLCANKCKSEEQVIHSQFRHCLCRDVHRSLRHPVLRVLPQLRGQQCNF